jgi:hypothetical protein
MQRLTYLVRSQRGLTPPAFRSCVTPWVITTRMRNDCLIAVLFIRSLYTPVWPLCFYPYFTKKSSRSVHIWEVDEVYICGKFTKCTHIGSSRSVHMWKVHVVYTYGKFTKCTYVESSRSVHVWEVHEEYTYGKFTKCAHMGSLRMYTYGKFTKCTHMGSSLSVHIWEVH